MSERDAVAETATVASIPPPDRGAGRSATALYLDDLRIGQRFISGSLTVEEDEIKSFAARFDPQPFHLDESAARASLFRGLAAGIPRRSACVCWSTAARRSRAV